MSSPDFDLPHPSPADCQGLLDPVAVRGLELFNARKYWLAHEALEEAWKEEPGEIRHLYRGILQVGVTYLHVERGNYVGAMKVYRRSRRWLDPFPGRCRGVDLDRLRLDLERVMAEVRRLGPERLGEIDLSLLKPVVWEKTVTSNQ
jgi:predicted metal-dependent hydrolase